MALLSKSDLNRIASGSAYKSKEFTQSRVAMSDSVKTYDIFLSHSFLDKDTVLQLNYLLEDVYELDVYVDWIENAGLDRSNVTPATAAQLRSAMDRSRSLLYAVSAKAASSKWMPWELGYSDAKHGLVAVLPITDYSETAEAYRGQEFVGLYPYINYEQSANSTNRFLWVHDAQDTSKYVQLKFWLGGQAPYLH